MQAEILNKRVRLNVRFSVVESIQRTTSLYVIHVIFSAESVSSRDLATETPGVRFVFVRMPFISRIATEMAKRINFN